MKAFTASTNIKATARKVWSIITDAPNYPQWEPGVVRIEGKIAAGEQITAYTKLSPNRAFPAKITEFVPNQKMVWSGGMPLGLFKGVRTFTLAPRPDGSLDFTLREEFSGPLLPLMAGSLPDMTQTFQEFVAGLKTHAERA